MAIREAGERQHDNAGGIRKLSSVAAGHNMQIKEKHYEKVREDFSQVHDSYRIFPPAFVHGWDDLRLLVSISFFCKCITLKSTISIGLYLEGILWRKEKRKKKGITIKY
jgi:hypothetical protein